MANVEDDTGPTIKREDFERASAHLLPKDPIKKEECNSKVYLRKYFGQYGPNGKRKPEVWNQKKWRTPQVL